MAPRQVASTASQAASVVATTPAASVVAAKQQSVLNEHFITYYPGQEQVDLKVEIKIPGSQWPGLTGAERRELYPCIAVEFDACHHFGYGQRAKKEPAIRFVSIEDIQDDAAHEG